MSKLKTETEEKYEINFPEFEISQLPVKESSNPEIPDRNSFDSKNLIKSAFSNLLIFGGVYLIYACSLIFFQVFIAEIAEISNPQSLILPALTGFILTFAGIGKLRKTKDLLLYLSVPLMAFVLAFLFNLAPADWHRKLFGVYSLMFFLPVLFGFYFLKENYFSQENGLE